ncbi:hypothetical protein ADUPG1_013879 [Aduncisulcus paluster]|uniref:NAC-A/B domain-containing protein n=1 Tax=Aduncisulcus paluster TaxID=2918883 RepID=A0ABQ5K6M4_9EUKA|nr:hypothetical protein ADUPG1_013879 [Aduncisulcus paluster]
MDRTADKIQKLGLIPVKDCERVLIKQQTYAFSIAEPSVFYNPRTKSYVIVGKIENQDAAKEAASHIDQTEIADVAKSAASAPAPTEESKVEEEVEINESDIELLMEQAPEDMTKDKVIELFKENDCDVVTTLMKLQELKGE